MSTPIKLIILILSSSIIGAFGSLMLKKASGNLELKIKSLFNWHLILGFFFYFIASLIGIIAYKSGDLSLIYPIGTSITYVWVLLLSYFILKEKIGVYKIIGIGLIITGVMVMLI